MDAANIRPGDILGADNRPVSGVLLRDDGSVVLLWGDYRVEPLESATYCDADSHFNVQNNWPESGLTEPLIRVKSGTSVFIPGGRLDGLILVWIGDDYDGRPMYAPIDNPTLAMDSDSERIFEYDTLDIKEES